MISLLQGDALYRALRLIPGSRSAGPRGLQSCCALGPHIKGRAHGPCRNGPCMMGGHAVQVLFDSQGRSTKNKSVSPEDIHFHYG